MVTESVSDDNDEMKRWMVWFIGSVEPVGVLASGRSDAMRIGGKARPQGTPEMAVGEDEGAEPDLRGVSDDELSTEENPSRFVEVFC